MKLIKFDFAKEFAKYPGGRFKRLGPSSGEEFRDDVLRPMLEKADRIDIDGSGVITSFSPSFLDECFGQLATEMGKEEFEKRIRLSSKDSPDLSEKLAYYIRRRFR